MYLCFLIIIIGVCFFFFFFFNRDFMDLLLSPASKVLNDWFEVLS